MYILQEPWSPDDTLRDTLLLIWKDYWSRQRTVGLLVTLEIYSKRNQLNISPAVILFSSFRVREKRLARRSYSERLLTAHKLSWSVPLDNRHALLTRDWSMSWLRLTRRTGASSSDVICQQLYHLFRRLNSKFNKMEHYSCCLRSVENQIKSPGRHSYARPGWDYLGWEHPTWTSGIID